MWCILEDLFEVVGGVVVIVCLTMSSILSRPSRVLVNLRNRKPLSGRKIEYPVPFSIVGVHERGTTPFTVLGL
jgi:hypothetical protein